MIWTVSTAVLALEPIRCIRLIGLICLMTSLVSLILPGRGVLKLSLVVVVCRVVLIIVGRVRLSSVGFYRFIRLMQAPLLILAVQGFRFEAKKIGRFLIVWNVWIGEPMLLGAIRRVCLSYSVEAS